MRRAVQNQGGSSLVRCLLAFPVVVEATHLLNRQDSRLCLELLDAIHSGVYQANRGGANRIFTLDRRDFSVFRNATGEQLILLPT